MLLSMPQLSDCIKQPEYNVKICRGHLFLQGSSNSLVRDRIPSLQDTLQSVPDPLKHQLKTLQSKLKKSDQRCIELKLENDDLEQYTLRQNIGISSINENIEENTDSHVVDFVNKTMEMGLDIRDIDRSHVGHPGSKKIHFMESKTTI